MSGFNNPVIGGDDTLVRQAMQSEGFQAGTAGWRIERTGDAEFNSVVIRGTLQTGDTQYILIESGANGNRIQFFSGDPAEVAPGVVEVGQPSAGQATLTVQAPDLGFGSPPALTLTSGALVTDNNADLTSPYSLSESGEIWSGFFSQLYDLTAPLINLSGGAGGVNVTGVLAAASGITLPAGEYVKRGGLGTITFKNGWGNFGGGFQGVRYIEFPDDTGGIIGVASGGTATNGTVIFTLPGLWPTFNNTFDAPCNNGKHAQIIVQSNGDVVLSNPDTGVTWVSLGGIRWPIAGF